MTFVILFAILVLAFVIGYWYRGWEHNLDITDSDGEYLGS